MKCPNCNTTEHPAGGSICHICGTALMSTTPRASQDNRRSTARSRGGTLRQPTAIAYKRIWRILASILRYLLLTCLLLEIIYFSILERQFETGWWITLIYIVNAPAFLCALFLCISTDIDGNDTDKGFWRIYHNWLHILSAALVIVLAYLTVCHIQNILTFPLLGLLMLPIVAFDFN